MPSVPSPCVDASVVEPKLEGVSVVEEFSDVFSKELPGLPPDKEIEFVINLLFGMALISKAL